MKKGLFFVIDGTDGSGKGTQVRMLHKVLAELGHKVKIYDFPQYGNISADMVAAYLNGSFGQDPKDVPAEVATMFFAIDRWSVMPQMKKDLSEGYILLSNRYVSANKGHQGGKFVDDKERFEEFIKNVNTIEYKFCQLPKPDKIFFLHVPPEIGQKLVDKKDPEHRKYAGGKKRDIHESDLQHLKDAEQSYLQVAKMEGWDVVKCIDSTGNIRTIEDINIELLSEIKKLL